MFEQFGNLRAEEIEEAINRMGGAKGLRRFNKGELVLREFGDTVSHGKELPVIQTIELGTFKSWEDMKMALSKGPHWYPLKSCTLFPKEVEVDLVVATVAELIETERKRKARWHVYNAAEKRGLSLCPMEVAPQFCLQWDENRFPLEHLYVATKPFYVENGDFPGDYGKGWNGCIFELRGRHVNFTNLTTYPMHAKFLFVRQRKENVT